MCACVFILSFQRGTLHLQKTEKKARKEIGALNPAQPSLAPSLCRFFFFLVQAFRCES